MPSGTIVVSTPVTRTARVLQLEGIFDVPPSQRTENTWNVDFDLPDQWNIGVIVGPSGCGKTTIARRFFGDYISRGHHWSDDKSIIDDFPREMSIKDICDILSSVGFSSPPSWIKPFRVLSNGEQFRVSLARTLAESGDISVVDEFSSVVDRTVAQIGSAAIAKTVRRKNKKFIAVTCHYDILDWLQPDWVYQPATGEYYCGRWLQQRPPINLDIQRVDSSAWKIFRKHHYLDTNLNKSAACFVAMWNSIPVAFTAVLHFPHPSSDKIKREHRTVCLPDYQGVGIGNAMSNYIGSVVAGIGMRYLSTTSHPAMIRYRSMNAAWSMITPPTIKGKAMPKSKGVSLASGKWNASNRIRATFAYVGPKLDPDTAIKIWNGD